MLKLCVKLYSGAIASADNIANIIVPVTSQLVLVSWSANYIITGAVGNSIIYQLSTMSTKQALANDARGIIDEFSVGGDKAANFNGADNKVSPLPGIRFEAGDKVYLHLTTITAFATSQVNVNLFFA